MSGLRVSDRDLKVMLDLYQNVFFSFYQIRESHFTDRAKPTVYNRLSKLIQNNLISSLSVNLQAKHRDEKEIGVLYQVTRKGIETLKEYFPQIVFRKVPAPINMSTLYHDLLLTDILRTMKSEFSEWEFINSKVKQNSTGFRDKLPDAVMKNRFSNDANAIELELTPKSEKRYKEIFLNYQMNSDFKKVLYIVSSDQVRRKIGGVLSGFGNSYDFKCPTGKFYFINVPDLLSQGSLVTFDNGESRFCNNFQSNDLTMEVI